MVVDMVLEYQMMWWGIWFWRGKVSVVDMDLAKEVKVVVVDMAFEEVKVVLVDMVLERKS